MANPFDDFDTPSAGGVGTAPAPSPSPAPAKPQANPFDSFDATKNPFDAFDGPSPEVLANDPNYSAEHAAIGHAQGSPEWESAFAADQARKNRGVGAKVAGGAKTFLSPQPWIEGVKGVGNFLGGLGVTAFDTAREGLASAGAGLAGAVGADDTSNALGQTATRLKAENILAGQQNEENIRNLGRIAKQHPVMTNIATAGTAGAVQPFVPPDDARIDFANRVEHARREQQLAGGTPLDTGAIAALARNPSVLGAVNPAFSFLPSNQEKLSETYGPEGLNAIGTAVDPSVVAMKTAAGDPTNLLLAGAPGLPGAATVGGRLTQGLGKLAQLPMAGAEAAAGALPHLGPVGRIAAIATGGGASYHAIAAIAAHPAGAAIIGALAAGAKGLQVLGRAAEAQGAEIATGIPSEFTTRAATAAATGTSDTAANLMRGTGNAITQGVTTPVAMAPVNYAMAEGDPKKFAESEAGATTFGGALGAFTRNRPALVEAIRPHLQDLGTKALTEAAAGNDPLAARSAAYIATLPPESKARTLETIGALQGLPTNTPNGPQRAKLYVLSDADYKDTIAQKFGMQQAAMGGGRGFYIGDDGAAYVNGDYHSGLGPDELAHTIGHEFGGHAAVNIMQAAGAKGGALYDGMIGAAKDALMPRRRPSPEFARFIDGYNKAFDPTGQTQRLDPTNPEALEEFIAETAGHIMAKRGAGELAIPQNIQDRISQGIGRFMGGMLGMDTREIGGDTHFGRKEEGAVTQAVQDTLGQVVGMKLRGGAEIPEAPKTDTTRIAELNEILSRPRPAAGSPVEAVRQWRTDQRTAQRELDELAPAQTPAFPAAGQPPVPPSSPVAPPPAPTPSRARVAAALRMNGIPAAEAQQWAQSAQGSTVDEMVLDALKRRGAQKFPSQTPSVEPIPSQPEVLPRAANVGPENQQVTPNEQPTTQSAPAVNVPKKPAGTETLPPRPPDTEIPSPISPADVDRIAAQAEEAVKAARAGTKKKATTLPKEVTDAQVDAVAAAHDEGLPANYQGVRMRKDATGKTTISGTFNPSRPFDAFLLKLADISQKHVGILQDLQSKLGQTVTVNYGHAPAEEGEVTAGARKAAQGASSAQDRASGDAEAQHEDKNFIPLEVRFNKGKDSPSITVLGASPEKLLNNFNLTSKAVSELGGDVPYRDIHDPHLVADMKGVARNHANGWKGDGSARIEGFPDTPIPAASEGFNPYEIPIDRFEFLNLILGDESAKTGKKGTSPEQTLKQGLAAKNQIPMTEAGETNMLRESINRAKGPVTGPDGQPTTWSKATIENPLSEALRVDLINEVKPEVNNADESIRKHGYLGDIGRFFGEGSPNRNFTAAGFLPDTGPKSAKERAQERIASASVNPKERDQIAWALDAMKDYWSDKGNIEDHGFSEPPKLPEINGSKLNTDGVPSEVMDDLKYRLTEQLQDMAENEDGDQKKTARGAATAARSAWKKIAASGKTNADTPAPAGATPPAGQGPSAGQRNLPSRGGTSETNTRNGAFMPDTGTPAEGETPGERLMREAEAAGLAPSLETMKGVMRGDDAAFTKLRKMIKDKTGSPAKFMPRETLGAEDAAAKVGEFNRNDPETWPKDIGTGVEKPDEYQSSWLWALTPKEKAQMRNEVRENPDGFDLTRFQTKAKQEFARRQSEAQMRAQSLKKQVDKSKFFFMPGTAKEEARRRLAMPMPITDQARIDALNNNRQTAGTHYNERMTTLWRSSDNPEAKAGAHFSESEQNARAYQDNPGFGGSDLYRFNVDASRTANVGTLRDLATELEPHLSEQQRQWADENGGLLSAMKDMGYDHVFHALENSFGPRVDRIDPVKLLSKNNDWIRFVDDYPQGSITYRYIGDKALHPEQMEHAR